MLKEYDRLKFEYDSSLAKIEMRIKDNYEKKNKEVNFRYSIHLYIKANVRLFFPVVSIQKIVVCYMKF